MKCLFGTGMQFQLSPENNIKHTHVAQCRQKTKVKVLKEMANESGWDGVEGGMDDWVGCCIDCMLENSAFLCQESWEWEMGADMGGG